MSTREPNRLLREDPALPADLRRAFAAYADISPSAGARDALFARIDRCPTNASGDSVATPVAKTSRRGLWLVMSLLGLSMAGVVSWHLLAGEAELTSAELGTAIATHEPIVSQSAMDRAGASDAPEESVSAQPIVVPTPQVMPVEPTEKRARARVTPAASARPKKTAEPGTTIEELALLSRAKRVLSSDARAALDITREHAERFPRGVFREEREVIAIEALSRSGRREAAQTRASAFRQAFPRSTHLDRLAVILRGP